MREEGISPSLLKRVKLLGSLTAEEFEGLLKKSASDSKRWTKPWIAKRAKSYGRGNRKGQRNSPPFPFVQTGRQRPP